MNKKHTSRLLQIAAAVCLLLCMQNVLGINTKQCFATAKTALENVYCELVEKGKGQSLPAFNEFRRNPPTTQNLILRGPAKRAGILLPKLSTQKKKKTVKPNKSPLKSRAPKTPPQAVTNNIEKNKRINKTTNLQGCQINKERLVCGRETYYLAINIPVNRLPANVLADTNRLQFRKKRPDQESVEYLSQLYPRYIEKMLSIGLGDSTVSFTKFHAIFQVSIEQQNSFTQRFEEMYELLKKERKTQAIKQRYRNNYPNNIEQCMQLNRNLIACDNVKQNWVYRAETL